MKLLRTCLFIISAVCCLETYARVHEELTKDQLIRMLRRVPVPETCSMTQYKQLLFATLIIDGDMFDLFCEKRNEIHFYAEDPLTNRDGSKEYSMIKVLFNTAKQTLKYMHFSGKNMGKFLEDKHYELQPLGELKVPIDMESIPGQSIIAYQNKVAPQPLKRDLDRIWSFLKKHCENTRADSEHLIIITIGGVMVPANFDCALNKVQIQDRELAGQQYLLVTTDGPSDIFKYDYSLETGEFSAPTAWGVLQIQVHPGVHKRINWRDNDDIIEFKKIHFPLQIFEKDLQDIRIRMWESRNSQVDAAKPKWKCVLEEIQTFFINSKGGIVVNGEVLMGIILSTWNKTGDGDDSMIKIQAPTFAPHKEVYLSETGFKRASLLMGWKALENIQDYYVKGNFSNEWPEYSSEYADMRFVRRVLTEILEESKRGLPRNKTKNCVQKAYFVFQKRTFLETKLDVCERVIELQDLEVLRLKRATAGLEAFKTFYDFVYFLRKDFATKDGALQDALSVRLKHFDESSCTECFLMRRYNTDLDDWTIYLSGP